MRGYLLNKKPKASSYIKTSEKFKSLKFEFAILDNNDDDA